MAEAPQRVCEDANVGKRAYRFVPLKADGNPKENSEYTHITVDERRVGDVLDADLLGHTKWEVVEVREETGRLVGASDASGADIPLAGTIICRGIDDADALGAS